MGPLELDYASFKSITSVEWESMMSVRTVANGTMISCFKGVLPFSNVQPILLSATCNSATLKDQVSGTKARRACPACIPGPLVLGFSPTTNDPGLQQTMMHTMQASSTITQ